MNKQKKPKDEPLSEPVPPSSLPASGDELEASPAADSPAGEAPIERPAEPLGKGPASSGSKQARQILSWTRDRLDVNLPKIEAFQSRAEASPDSAASSLDEMATIFRNMAHAFEVRSALLRQGPGEPNSILQVTAKHVKSELLDAAAALDIGPQHPTSWKNAKTRVKEAGKIIDHVEGVLAVDGVSLVASEGEPLRDPEGKPLVDKKGA